MTTELHDLRGLFFDIVTAAMAAEDDDDDEGDTDEDDDELEDDEDSSSPPADDADDDQDDDDDEEPEPPKAKRPKVDPKLRKLQQENARRRIEAKKERQRADAAEGQVRELRLRLAFNDLASAAKVEDRDAAWTLVADDLAAVKVDDDGPDVDRLGEIVAHVTKRYPYLVNEDATDPQPAPSGKPSVRPAGNGRVRTKALDTQAIARRFPALAGRSRR